MPLLYMSSVLVSSVSNNVSVKLAEAELKTEQTWDM